MSSMEAHNTLNIRYSLHPVIAQLNMQLLHSNPHNPYHFIKLWAQNKLKQIYEHEDDQPDNNSEEEEVIKKKIIFSDKLSIHNQPKHSAALEHASKQQKEIKRRTAVFFYHEEAQRAHEYTPKSEQTKSRIMISLKNDIFFKDMSWDQISAFVEMGEAFETQEEDQIVQAANEPFTEFVIVVSGEVIKQTQEGDIVSTHYTGECLFHESFLHPGKSSYFYVCHEPKTLLFRLIGSDIRTQIQSIAHQNFLFYQKVLMNKEEFNYLDDEQKDKLIGCFKRKRDIMQGEVIFRGQDNSDQEKRIYIVVRGEFSKCKRNLSNELMPFKTLREGDFFGEQNLQAFTNLDYTVICLQDNSEIAYLQKNSFEQSVDTYERIVQRAKMQVKYATC